MNQVLQCVLLDLTHETYLHMAIEQLKKSLKQNLHGNVRVERKLLNCFPEDSSKFSTSLILILIHSINAEFERLKAMRIYCSTWL